MVLVYVHLLTGLCGVAWHAVGYILACLDCNEMAVVFALIAHDFAGTVPASLLKNKQWIELLNTAPLSDHWEWLSENDQLASLENFKAKLYQSPTLLGNLICDLLRMRPGGCFMQEDEKISTLPIYDLDYKIIKTSFHPTRPLVAILYKKKPDGVAENVYQIVVHAFGGRERRQTGAIVYHRTSSRVPSCKPARLDYWFRKNLVELVWSPSGKYLLTLEKIPADNYDWEVSLFIWNGSTCTMKRIVTDELPHYSGRRVYKNFKRCWSSNNSFWIMTRGNDCTDSDYSVVPTWTKVTICLKKKSEVVLKTQVFSEGVPDLRFANNARSIWLLRDGSRNVFVWAEKCHESDHFGHSLVRYRVEGSASSPDEPDTRGFVLDAGTVLAGDIDSTDPSCLILLVAQPLEMLEDNLLQHDPSKINLLWSAIPTAGLKFAKYPYQAKTSREKLLSCNNIEINFEDYFFTSHYAQHDLFVVRVQASNPGLPLTANRISGHFKHGIGSLDSKWDTFTFVAQSNTEIMIREDSVAECTFIVSKLLPFHYHTPHCNGYIFWHPNQPIYIARWSSYEPIAAANIDTDEDEEEGGSSSSGNRNWGFKMFPPSKRASRDSYVVCLKNNVPDYSYKKDLLWQSVKRKPHRLCKVANCSECSREIEKIITQEWNNPLKSKMLKKE